MLSSNAMARKYKFIIIDLIVIFFTCNLLLQFHYSSDTYKILFTPINNADVHLRDGRYISAGIYYTLALMGVNVARIQSALVAMFMLTVAGLTVYLSEVIAELNARANYLLINFSLLLLFHNSFISEWYLFPEVGLMYTICLITVVWAAVLALKIFENGNYLKGLLGVLFLLWISFGCYQVSVSYFAIILMLLVGVREKFCFNKRSIITILLSVLIGMMACVLSLGTTKLLTFVHIMPPTSRGASFSWAVIQQNLKTIVEFQPNLLGSASGMFKIGCVPVLVVGMGCILFALYYKKQVKLSQLFFLGTVLLSAYISIFIPHIISASMWLSHRTLVGFWGEFTIVFIFIVTFVSGRKFRLIHTFTAILICIVLGMNCYVMQWISSEHLAMDKMDVMYAQAIQAEIERYQNSEQVQITNIATTMDKNPTWLYPEIHNFGYDINVKNILRSWSDKELINMANGTSYEKVDMDPEIQEIFSAKDWDKYVPQEQIIFSGNTANICYY